MPHDTKTWQHILENLNRGTPVILLVVLESKGSSPGRQGFKMAVSENGITGSIGGGIMEHKFVELAKERLKEQLSGTLVRTQYHDKQAAKNQSGMICSGEQTIAILTLKKEDTPAIQKLLYSLSENLYGLLQVTQGGILFSEANVQQEDYHFELKSETDWKYSEKTGSKNKLFIIGGGHCSLALSKLMRSMDFYITVFDDRPGLNTLGENKYAHDIKLVKNFSEVESIPSGKNHYVVIMTMGYRGDDEAFRTICNKDFNYIGILGSQSKMNQLFTEWKRDGISEAAIQKVRTPIGIQIHSQTPEEIAVSIAAEIIQVKNG